VKLVVGSSTAAADRRASADFMAGTWSKLKQGQGSG
jgi:hypothetical protein